MSSSNWPFLRDVPVRQGVHLMSDPPAYAALYGQVRSVEQRILTDEQVRRLPIGDGLWNAAEWRIRTRSSEQLINTLERSSKGKRILDVGCGNGWLSAMIQRHGHHVLAIDGSTDELEQAARVFPNGPAFARADLHDPGIPVASFDLVLFAASIQYFSDPCLAVRRALELLVPGGEVHIMDSILYPDAEAASAARDRSRAYFRSIDAAEMSTHYHAHLLRDLEGDWNMRIHQRPVRFPRIASLLGRDPSPFTHVIISR